MRGSTRFKAQRVAPQTPSTWSPHQYAFAARMAMFVNSYIYVKRSPVYHVKPGVVVSAANFHRKGVGFDSRRLHCYFAVGLVCYVYIHIFM